ncbi:putative membrane protein [Rickettsia amblyommatis str. Ac/Pa]|uniref:Putative membrane protein n=1 Tax=Rickettsia amblyommatis str. Ac/Pa TaxID=1359164 RepID=A0A0F3N1U6_RICAM|nr:putative membrane protein [Rickettsia amblyommatis str. Ac/Pa]
MLLLVLLPNSGRLVATSASFTTAALYGVCYIFLCNGFRSFR